MRRALVFLVAALAFMVVPLGAAETSYSDPAGDSGSGPDITAVTVSNDNVTSMWGRIKMRLTARMSVGSTAAVFMDTDLNPATGDDGIDRIFGIEVISPELFIPFSLTWNGTEFVENSTTAVGDQSITPTEVSFSFLKGTIEKGFSFWILTLEPGDDPPVGDEAPDVGLWTYLLTASPPVKPLIGKPVTTGAPAAGRKFTVSFPITSSVDGQPLTTGTAECKTTVSGKTVPHTHTFKGGTVKAVVAVPKTAKGKQLKIAVKVTADTAATKVSTFKVR